MEDSRDQVELRDFDCGYKPCADDETLSTKAMRASLTLNHAVDIPLIKASSLLESNNLSSSCLSSAERKSLHSRETVTDSNSRKLIESINTQEREDYQSDSFGPPLSIEIVNDPTLRRKACAMVLDQVIDLEHKILQRKSSALTPCDSTAALNLNAPPIQQRNNHFKQVKIAARGEVDPLPVLDNMEFALQALSKQLLESVDREKDRSARQLEKEIQRPKPSASQESHDGEPHQDFMFTLHGQVISASDLPNNRVVPTNPSVKVFYLSPGKAHFLLRPKTLIHQTPLGVDSVNPRWESSFQCNLRPGELLFSVYANISSEAFFLGHGQMILSHSPRSISQASLIPIVALSGTQLSQKSTLAIKLITHSILPEHLFPSPQPRRAQTACVSSPILSPFGLPPRSPRPPTPTQLPKAADSLKNLEIADQVRERKKIHGISQRSKAQKRIEEENGKIAKRLQTLRSKKGSQKSVATLHPYGNSSKPVERRGSLTDRPDWDSSASLASITQRPVSSSSVKLRNKMKNASKLLTSISNEMDGLTFRHNKRS